MLEVLRNMNFNVFTPFLKISKEDLLPKKICERCVNKVEQFFEWRSNSVQTDLIFRNYAESMRAVTATINFQVSFFDIFFYTFNTNLISFRHVGRKCEH